MKHVVAMVVFLGAILPAFAAQPTSVNVAAAGSSKAAGCASEGDGQFAAGNAEYVWRLRAYEHLDCVIAMLDEALNTKSNAIVLSREDAEHARARLWAARDAAARIGR